MSIHPGGDVVYFDPATSPEVLPGRSGSPGGDFLGSVAEGGGGGRSGPGGDGSFLGGGHGGGGIGLGAFAVVLPPQVVDVGAYAAAQALMAAYVATLPPGDTRDALENYVADRPALGGGGGRGGAVGGAPGAGGGGGGTSFVPGAAAPTAGGGGGGRNVPETNGGPGFAMLFFRIP